MTAPIRAAAGVAAVLVLAIGSLVILNGPLRSNVGGSPSPSVGVSPSPSSSRSPTPSGPLDGTSWTTQIVASDTPQGVPAVAVGTWTLSFVASDVYGPTVSLGNPRGGGPGYPMKYRSNNEVELPSDPTCASEERRPTGESTSIYKYEIAGNTLTFTLVTTDSCLARVVNLTAHPWTKAP